MGIVGMNRNDFMGMRECRGREKWVTGMRCGLVRENVVRPRGMNISVDMRGMKRM